MAIIAVDLLPEFRDGTSVIPPVISRGMVALTGSDRAPEARDYCSLVEVEESEYDEGQALADWFRYVERHGQEISSAFGVPVTFEPSGDFCYIVPGVRRPPLRWYIDIDLDGEEDDFSDEDVSSDEDISS